jgi:hypothetical protein
LRYPYVLPGSVVPMGSLSVLSPCDIHLMRCSYGNRVETLCWWGRA